MAAPGAREIMPPIGSSGVEPSVTHATCTTAMPEVICSRCRMIFNARLICQPLSPPGLLDTRQHAFLCILKYTQAKIYIIYADGARPAPVADVPPQRAANSAAKLIAWAGRHIFRSINRIPRDVAGDIWESGHHFIKLQSTMSDRDFETVALLDADDNAFDGHLLCSITPPHRRGAGMREFLMSSSRMHIILRLPIFVAGRHAMSSRKAPADQSCA